MIPDTRPDGRPHPLAKYRDAMALKVKRGVVGLTKAALGLDRASDETIKARLAICETCEHATVTAGIVKRCALCGCAYQAKVRLAGESCPIGKWSKA